MNARRLVMLSGMIATLALLSGCATPKPYDYTNFRQHRPRSILVLPPLNESTAVGATYSYLSTVTEPLAEMGYYVYPVAVVDQFLKENGMPSAGEMHQVPLNKVTEILGADAVLYLTVKNYGSKYQVIDSTTLVVAYGKLVDTKTGMLLWEGTGAAKESSSGTGNILGDLISAAVTQVLTSGTDAAHDLCKPANRSMFYNEHRGLLYGPHHPKYDLSAE